MPVESPFGLLPAGSPLAAACSPVNSAFSGLSPVNFFNGEATPGGSPTAAGAGLSPAAKVVPSVVTAMPKKLLLSRLREMHEGWKATEQFFLEQQAATPTWESTEGSYSAVSPSNTSHSNGPRSNASPALSPKTDEVAYLPTQRHWHDCPGVSTSNGGQTSSVTGDRFMQNPMGNEGLSYRPGELLTKSAELIAASEPQVEVQGERLRSDCSMTETLDASPVAAAPKPMLVEQTASEEVADLPSVGSVGHATGECKPCAFVFTKGCSAGHECKFCHLCDAGARRRRHQEKKAYYSVLRQMQKPGGTGTMCSTAEGAPPK